MHSKALFEIFYNLLTARRTVSNMYAQVARVQSCANHVRRIEHLPRASVMLRATWYEGTAQLLSLTELKWHLFELYCIGWTIKPMKEGGNRSTRRKPLATSFRLSIYRPFLTLTSYSLTESAVLAPFLSSHHFSSAICWRVKTELFLSE